MKKLTSCIITLSLLAFSIPAFSKEKEVYYQHIFCDSKNGVAEFVLEDRSRVDCLTSTEAIEVDFAHKWAESIGQALLYANMLDKEPAVLLIVNDKSTKYVTRFHNASDGLGIKLYIIEE